MKNSESFWLAAAEMGSVEVGHDADAAHVEGIVALLSAAEATGSTRRIRVRLLMPGPSPAAGPRGAPASLALVRLAVLARDLEGVVPGGKGEPPLEDDVAELEAFGLVRGPVKG